MDFLKVSVVVLFVILTILTIKIHPEIHQPMLIEDADFKLVRISDTLTSENTPITVALQPQKVQQTQQTVVPVQTTPKTIEVKKEQETISQPTKTKPLKIKFPKKEVPVQTKTQTPEEPQETQMELLQKLLNTDIEDSKALQENAQKLAQTMQPKLQPQQQASTHKNPYMTEQEELIAWNKWRSNIHNQVMKDSNAGTAPFGTLFSFSFLVDKFGNVSNIKVSCSNNFCMDIARNNLKPAISNLQRKPILNFPRGTQRTSVIVNGSFLIGTEDRFSTPSHFSDIERVVH